MALTRPPRLEYTQPEAYERNVFQNGFCDLELGDEVLMQRERRSLVRVRKILKERTKLRTISII
jgi:hypothetical protein